MAEPRRDSTSSLQRKKPPWLKLDIPTAQVSVDEAPVFVQPVKRHGFHRSVSMPVETSHLPSPPRDLFDPRRAAFQRQSSITQTIKSSRRVHFERINTVPIKGHRAGRHSFRRHQSLSRTLLRYRGVQEAWRGSSHTQPTHKGTCSRGTVPSLAQSASVLKL